MKSSILKAIRVRAKEYFIPDVWLMSKTSLSFLLLFPVCVLILQLFNNSIAQEIDATIKIATEPQVSANIRVTIAPGGAPRDIWFLDKYAGVMDLSGRLSFVYFYDKQGYLIARKQFSGGETVSTRNIGGFGYTVDIGPRPGASAVHVTWLQGESGVMMLDDLFPQSIGKTVKVKFVVPAGWQVVTTERQTGPNVFAVSNIEKAVFYLGSKTREQQIKQGNTLLGISIAGEWLFSDAEAGATAESIFTAYSKQIGRLPDGPFRVWIGKFPNPTQVGEWEADTRGRSITIASSDMPFRSQSVQRLHEQLRHEIFHLWIPNGVALSGNYDWFYEGFALYESLRLGVAVNRIRFEDLLDTLSRAHDIDAFSPQKLSLIEASRNRWSGSNTHVYARGMLVAFLCDLALLDRSGGNRSVDHLIAEIYKQHRLPSAVQDGNAAVLASLRSNPELVPVIDRYITGAEHIDWGALLSAAGLEAGTKDQPTRLAVVPKPSARQKKLLNKLGYNSWKKLSNNTR
jgi:hypothetical protein